jgi:hypothetical protein
LTVIFLETAELRVKERKDLTIQYWRENVDKLLTFNDKPILSTAGRVSHAQMETKVGEIYKEFDARRKHEKALEADMDDLRELDELAKVVTKTKLGES